MAFGHGKSTNFYAGAFDLTGIFREVTWSGEVDTADSSTFTDDARTFIGGMDSASFQANGLFDGTAGKTSELISALRGANTVIASYWPQGDTAGNSGVSCSGLETQVETQSPLDDIVMANASGVSCVGFEPTISLAALSARGGTANLTAVDRTAADSEAGWSGYLHVTALSAGTATIEIHDSADNSTFGTLGVFTAVAGRTSERIAGTHIPRRYVRARHATTVGGTVTFNVGFSNNPGRQS